MIARTLPRSFTIVSVLFACGGAAAEVPPSATVGRAAEPSLVEPGATLAQADPASAAAEAWAGVLRHYVTNDGGFRYEALLASADDLANLREYLAWAATADTASMPRLGQLAFYINTYNALTVNSMIELWPVDGVLQEDGFFDGRIHRVAGEDLTLNALENDKIRAGFGEPRIHFLVNCASASCPWLIEEVVTEANIEALLEAQATSYIQRTTQLDRDAGTFAVSQIFEWFASDFEAAGGAREFVRARLTEADAAFVADTANTMGFWPYDWATNAR